MATNPGAAPTDLMLVADIAREYGMGESTVWLYIRRYGVPRYRMPLHGKKTLISRGDFERLATTPIPVQPPAKKLVA